MFISSVRYLCGTYILTEDEHFGSFLFEVSFYTIIRTLSNIIAVTEKIAQGDLTVLIKTKRKDEFGQLSNAVDKMTENTKNIIANINEATARLAIGTKKISQVSNSLSKGTTEQAGAVEELTATIGGILEQTKNNAENAINSAEAAKEAEVLSAEAKGLHEVASKFKLK